MLFDFIKERRRDTTLSRVEHKPCVENELSSVVDEENYHKLITIMEQAAEQYGISFDRDSLLVIGTDMLGMLGNHFENVVPLLFSSSYQLAGGMESICSFEKGKISRRPLIFLNQNVVFTGSGEVMSADVDAVMKQVCLIHYVREYAKMVGNDDMLSSDFKMEPGYIAWAQYRASYIGNMVRISINKENKVVGLADDIISVNSAVRMKLGNAYARKYNSDISYLLADYFGCIAAWIDMYPELIRKDRAFIMDTLYFTKEMLDMFYALRGCGANIDLVTAHRFARLWEVDTDFFMGNMSGYRRKA